jgi:4-amino-4-deoxy-L-arabinose transferase-like glycosyltransferase
VLLLLVTLVGGVLRANVASSPHRSQSVDERAYARLARNLTRHHRYTAPEMSDPTHWAPGAPLVFAIAQRVHPRYPNHPIDVPAAYPVQAALGTVEIPAVFVLTCLLAGAWPGLVAAALIAAYPPLINASGDLLTEPLGALMLTLSLIALVVALQRGGPWRALLAGLLLGMTVLVRADMLVIPFGLTVLLAVVTWRRCGRRSGLVTGASMLVGVLAMLAPWSAYATSKSGRFTPVSSGGASNLYVGTYLPGNGSMFGVKKAWSERTAARFPEERGKAYWRIPQSKVMATIAATYPDLDRESALRKAAADNIRRYVLRDPIGFTGLAVRKVLRMWRQYFIGTYGERHLVVTIYHLALVIVSALALVAGLVVRRGRSPELWAIVIVIALLTAMNVVLVAEARHNMPLIPVLACGGVAGAAIAIAEVRGRARARAGQLLAGV